METTVLTNNDRAVDLRQHEDSPDNQDTIIASMILNKLHPCHRTWPPDYAQNNSVRIQSPDIVHAR